MARGGEVAQSGVASGVRCLGRSGAQGLGWASSFPWFDHRDSEGTLGNRLLLDKVNLRVVGPNCFLRRGWFSHTY